MSPKEELIRTIRQSPDEKVEQLSSLLSELKHKEIAIAQVLQMLSDLPKNPPLKQRNQILRKLCWSVWEENLNICFLSADCQIEIIDAI